MADEAAEHFLLPLLLLLFRPWLLLVRGRRAATVVTVAVKVTMEMMRRRAMAATSVAATAKATAKAVALAEWPKAVSQFSAFA